LERPLLALELSYQLPFILFHDAGTSFLLYTCYQSLHITLRITTDGRKQLLKLTRVHWSVFTIIVMTIAHSALWAGYCFAYFQFGLNFQTIAAAGDIINWLASWEILLSSKQQNPGQS
jgi:hypothetical protein